MDALDASFNLSEAVDALKSASSPASARLLEANRDPSVMPSPARLAFPSPPPLLPVRPRRKPSSDGEIVFDRGPELVPEREPDEDELASFFKARSANIDSPMFYPRTAPRSHVIQETPEMRVHPEKPAFGAVSAQQQLPDGVMPELVAEIPFERGFHDETVDVNLHWRAASVPLPFAVNIQVLGEKPPQAVHMKLVRETAADLFVVVGAETVKVQQSVGLSWDNAQEGDACSPASNEDTVDDHDDIALTFWAAPGKELRRGSALLQITVVDFDSAEYSMHVKLTAKGTKPLLAIEAPDVPADASNKEVTLKFTGGQNFMEHPITIWNETENGAPVLIAIHLEDSGSGAFAIGQDEHEDVKSIITTIQSGSSFTFLSRFELPSVRSPDPVPTCFFGHAVVRFAYFLPKDTQSEYQVDSYYNHVIYLQAPRDEVTMLTPRRLLPLRQQNSRFAEQRALFSLSDPASEPNFVPDMYKVSDDYEQNADEVDGFYANDEKLSAEKLIRDDEADEYRRTVDSPIDYEEDICQELSQMGDDADWANSMSNGDALLYAGLTPFSRKRHDSALSPEEDHRRLAAGSTPFHRKDARIFAGDEEDSVKQASSQLFQHIEDISTIELTNPKQTGACDLSTLFPKLRMPRSVQKRGLSMCESSNSVQLPLFNATSDTVEVNIRCKGSSRTNGLVSLSRESIFVDPNSRHNVTLPRASGSGGSQTLRIACRIARNGINSISSAPTTVYEVPLTVQPSRESS